MIFRNPFSPKIEPTKLQNKSELHTYVGGQYAAEVTFNNQQATNEMQIGMARFLDMVDRVHSKKPHFRRGNIFETIIAAKENASNAEQSISTRYQVTHLNGENTNPADLKIYQNDLLIGEAQAKFSAQAPNIIVKMITDPKYDGMELYVPADKIEGVKAELSRQLQNASDPETVYRLKDIIARLKQHNTDTIEVWDADRHPLKYAAKMEFEYATREVVISGYQAATGAAIIGGGISIVKNVVAAYDGRLSAEQALCNITKDTAKAAVRGGTVGSTGAVIRIGAQKAGLQAFSKANVATAVAASLLEVGGTVYDFAKGKISGETALIRMGQTGTSTMSGLYSGAAAGSVFGPVGAVVGSMVGYLLASSTYQSCIAVLENAKLAEAEADRVVALCDASCRVMREQRADFESLLETRLECKRKEFANIFQGIDYAMDNRNFTEVVDNLAELAGMFGQKLKLQSFAEFDDFMKHSSEPLRL